MGQLRRDDDDDEEDEWELVIKTKHGDLLPCSVANVGDLGGLHIEVIDGHGNTVLTGTIPNLPPADEDEDDD